MNSWLFQTNESLELSKSNHASRGYIEALETILRLHEKVPLTKEEILSQSVWQTLVHMADYGDGQMVLSEVVRILVRAGLYKTRKGAYSNLTSTIRYHKDQLCKISSGVYKLVDQIGVNGVESSIG